MHRRQVGTTGLTLAEIISYIILSTLFILYKCMFISISRYEQYVRQTQLIEKTVTVQGKRLNTLRIGMEKN